MKNEPNKKEKKISKIIWFDKNKKEHLRKYEYMTVYVDDMNMNRVVNKWYLKDKLPIQENDTKSRVISINLYRIYQR